MLTANEHVQDMLSLVFMCLFLLLFLGKLLVKSDLMLVHLPESRGKRTVTVGRKWCLGRKLDMIQQQMI